MIHLVKCLHSLCNLIDNKDGNPIVLRSGKIRCVISDNNNTTTVYVDDEGFRDIYELIRGIHPYKTSNTKCPILRSKWVDSERVLSRHRVAVNNYEKKFRKSDVYKRIQGA
jgi:hypothetical protein